MLNIKFGIIDDGAIMTIAQLAHEANRAYCVSIDDDSQQAWEDAPDWQKTSAIDGVRKLIMDRTTTARHSHESWMAHKRADGWSYGEVKDPEAKTHPCFVPYDELPEEQKVKDHIFRSVILGFMAAFHRPA